MADSPKQNSPSSGFLKTDGGKTKSGAIETPTISLPKGGGAIKGIDEKFSVNAVNGTASFSIPLPFSKARGASPSFNLSYDSGGGNGIFGLGWSLGLPSIKRKTDNELPQYLDSIESDTFLFSEAEDLVPAYGKELDGTFSIGPDERYVIDETDSPDNLYTIRFYRPRTEGLFARIERWMHKTSGEIKWRVITRENQTTLFGWSTASRIVDPKDDLRVFEWLPEFVFDDKGNCTRYVYKPEDGVGFDPARLHNKNRLLGGAITYTNLYLSRVLYGNLTPYKQLGDAFPPDADFMFQTVFDYGEYNPDAPYDEINDWDFRDDAFSVYKSGFEIRTTRLCKRVLLFHFFDELPGGSALVRSLDLAYDAGGQEGFTFLRSVTSRGYIKQAGWAYTSKELPPAEFEYQAVDWNTEIRTVLAENLVHSPTGLTEPAYQFTDLFGEGLSGILTEQGTGWYYKHNLGGGVFEQARLVSPKPSFTGLSNTLQLTDLESDGTKQIVNYSAEPRGFFELNDENQWQPFRNFDMLPNIDLRDGSTRMIDLTGDGRTDVVITQDSVFNWYESAGREGFLPARSTPRLFDEEAGPNVVFAEARQTIFLADMTGDGLTDIVRVTNGEICYWPNLGYGRFGAKVGIDKAPVFDYPEAFDPALIRLADIDGSGTADVIYLGKAGFTCWMNLSGNEFSTTPFAIDPFPEIHNPAAITVVDLLGNGVQCIVWSSELAKDAPASLRYVDLMNGKKPHVMTGYKNNLGKEVSIEYVASTRFYIDDKLAGKPWVTKLHFPVQCVARTVTRDMITGAHYTSTYKYHHGYFDHPEKEFRGFGMVEQTDTEDFDHWVKGGGDQIVDQTLHQAPVLTRSWFHTGAFLGLETLLDLFAGEYWYEEMARRGFAVANSEVPLPDARLIAASGIDPQVIDQMSGDEWSEALRACKNMALRVETFALDAPLIGATPEQLKTELSPFTVATHNCLIELLQPKGANRHAVFVVKESEALTYSYERQTDDPRIAHTLNIKLDDFGNVLESASIVYPRIMPDAALPPETQQEQAKCLITYSVNRFTDADIDTPDDYRLRQQSEAKTYELKGAQKVGALYGIADFDNILAASTEVGYHQIDVNPLPGNSQKRLVEHKRTIFYKSDLSGPLALHQMSANGLTFESYQLAYTPALVTDIFGAKVDAATLLEGKFTHSEGDDSWWVRSGTVQYIDGAETLADARDRFYVPVSYTDPYGAKTKVTYFSNYFLVVSETEDALQNRATVLAFNMRTLAPQRLRDANDNISEALSDELGLVKATALFGKGAEADDLTGISEFTGAAEAALVANFLAETDSVALTMFARGLLQHATTRFIYDVNAYRASGGAKPAVAAMIVREKHFTDEADSPVQLSFEYTSGFGKAVMKKVQAEPGLAKRVTVNPDDTYTVSVVDTAALIPPRLRWIGNGRTIENNKGNPVKQYEPYFSVTQGYESLKELVESGVTPLLYYDPVGRMTRKEFPDRTFSRTAFDSWEQSIYDQNDTVLDTAWYDNRFNRLIDAELTAAGKDPGREKIAAERAAKHLDTPLRQFFDTQGRPILQIEHSRDLADTDVFYETLVEVDLEGNLRRVTDARGNTVMLYKYDMLGNMVYQDSMDAGKRWLVQNIAGNPLRTWDERGHELSFEYDVLHRPISKRVDGGDGPAPLANVYEITVYGENLPNDKANNLRTRPVTVYDTAGKIETSSFDFKGNPSNSLRRFAADYKEVADWAGPDPDLKLDAETFESVFQYDALNRATRQTAPDLSVIEPAFNQAGLLDQVRVTQNAVTELFVRNIDYDEKGLRTKIRYGNDITTDYLYDHETFRLIGLLTKRQNDDPLQDLHYTFDPVGNITHIEDRNVPEVFFNNQKITAANSFTYDPLYRLIEAAGREHAGQLAFGAADNWDDLPFLKQYSQGDLMAWRNYTQQYSYDGVGNLDEMRHIAAAGNWTRSYDYAVDSNRLLSTTVGPETYNYQYHPEHGFITRMPHLQVMKWDFKDELQAAARQSVIDGSPETTWYVYDGTGKRCRKITENQAAAGIEPTRKSERLYVGGVEVYRDYGAGGAVDLERKSLHVMDDKSRIAMIETRTIGIDAAPPRLVRYQFGNHLGSACIETDAAARVISYEEYHPFGTTSYQAVDQDIQAAAKRYRYTGMERDEESGLEYHSARYCIPWLGRWLSPDPIGINGGVNFYAYAKGNPVKLSDPNGTDPPEPPDPPAPQDPGVGVGPFRFSNFQVSDATQFHLGASFSLQNLFSDDRSITVNSLSASGRLGLTSDVSIPAFNLTGSGGLHLDLDQLSIQDDRFRIAVSGSSRILLGPADLLHIDVDARAAGSMQIDRQIFFSNWRQHLDNSVSTFSGDAFVTARLGVGPAVGFFSVDANAQGGFSGTLSSSGYLRLGSYRLLEAQGSGAFTPESYRMSGSFHGNFPLLATGNWSMSSAEGFSASGHYLGPQFGPIGMNVGINPFEGQTGEGSRPPGGSIFMYEPGVSFGYTYFNYSSQGSFVFSAGFSPSSSVVEYNQQQPQVPVISSLPVVGEAVERALYGRALSTSVGPYAGVRLGWTF